jgi:hypothetical protein
LPDPFLTGDDQADFRFSADVFRRQHPTGDSLEPGRLNGYLQGFID